MESLNLNTLASSLPTAYQNAETELSNNFKAAALSITTLYRSSRLNSKRAFNAGYVAACQDLLTMIQQGVSLDPSGSTHDTGGMTIGRVMDWTEARLDAIKSRQEEEDEEEEREKEKERGRPPATTTSGPPTLQDKVKANSNTTVQPIKDLPSLPTPNSPRSQHSGHLPYEPSSPSPPPATALRPIQRATTKPRPPPKGDSTTLHTAPAASSFDSATDVLSPFPHPAPLSDIPIPIAAGAKRRHAMMMMLDSASSPTTISSSSTSHPPSVGGGSCASSANHGSGMLTSRRRTRSSRNLTTHQSQNQNLALIQTANEAMDVEEDSGRERKRVARR